ncbi:MAG: hypothetical protein ACKO1M_00690 [Planctomycetota bacterium]
MGEKLPDERRGEQGPITLPAALERRLYVFRGRVWRIKLLEAISGALFGVLVGYLAVFALDRITETPAGVRLAAFLGAVAACAAIPVAFHRWIWGQRGLEQLARLISRRFPGIGDQLLGIIELVRSAESPTGLGDRSRALCEAAIGQVAERAGTFDLDQAVPRPRHRAWMLAAAVPACLAIAAALAVPDAAANAWQRFLAPWWPVERFTFARLEPLPETIVVPRGEAAEVELRLTAATRSKPGRATVRIGGQERLEAGLGGDRYAFALPPQLEPAAVAVAAGDWRQKTRLEPMNRPEIRNLVAELELPEYLGRPDLIRQEVRGGTLAPVEGSELVLVATADRPLAAATIDGAPVTPAGDVLRTPARPVTGPETVTLTWRDDHGLDGSRPLVLSIAPKPDEAPTVVPLDLPPNRDVLLDTDTLRFRIDVRDDFGIRRVGLEWEGLAEWGGSDDPAARTRGERLLKAGGSDMEAIEAVATFCPAALGITPQPIFLRAFAEDYKPGRPRAVSTPLLIYVVDKAEHALVLNTRLAQFRQRASEVRDREMALLANNKELRELPAERLLDEDVRGRLAGQAAAEDANARRLERLVEEGGKLVREAMKNPDFEAGTLEQLAEDIQALADIAENRMPSVAELLEQAAAAKVATAGQGKQGEAGQAQAGQPQEGPSQPGEPREGQLAGEPGQSQPGEQGEPPPRAGEDRSKPGGGQGGEPGQTAPPIPQVVDKESSQPPKDPDAGGEQPPGGGGQGRLGLPSTQAGVSKPKPPGEAGEPEPPADEALDEAIARQEALLEEFAKVADELAAVMARLEGSTFVKRFKLASREQASIGGRLAGLAAEAFVATEERPAKIDEAIGGVRELTERETEKVSALMDDMQAYLDRRQLPAFRTVLEEMKDLDALGSLRQLADDVATKAGMSITQAEFWSDTFDRLADDLVPPQDGGGGGEGEGEQRESVPPEVVLETMKILEEEVNLREETRVAQQAKDAVDAEAFRATAAALADRQAGLADRVVDIVDRLLEEPDGERQFAQEIGLFDRVEEVMVEAADILGSPDTGSKAIGAETEAIEWLLAAQAASSNGGGGGGRGGGTPGGGATGTTSDSALALVGAGNRSAAASGGEDEQVTGVSGRVLPDEFRSGLGAYFNRLEKERP